MQFRKVTCIKRRSSVVQLLVAMTWFSLAQAQAQTITGAIAGRVVDAAGAAVPNAKVNVRNTEVASTRTLTSGADGAFRVTGLSSGAYTVEGRAGGLASRRPVRLTVTLGSSTEIVLRLEVATVKQNTTVNARGTTVEGNTVAPPTNTAEATVGSFLPGLTVTYLPNRDRDFTQFTNQAAAAEDDPDGSGVVIAGQRSNAVAVEVDGTRFTDPLLGGLRGKEDSTSFLPLSAVREFQIVHSGVDASVGDTGAGLISVATKAGANRARGDVFYTGRAPQFTSADAFGNSLDSVQNAFGVGYGSPIRRDRSFYFVSFEQDFVHAPYYVAFAPQAPGVDIPASLAAQQGEIVEHQSPTAVFGRLDVNVSSSNTLNTEFGYNRESRTSAGDGLTRSLSAPGFAANISGESFTTRIGLSSVLSARMFNAAVVAWSSDHRNRVPKSAAPEQFINGFGAIGGDASGQQLFTSQQTQVGDDLTLTHGHNEVAFGGRFAADPAYEQQEENLNGRFDYNSLAAYLDDQPRRFQQTFITGDTRYRGTVTELALYANTRVQLKTNLFLTAGIRWAAQWNPQPPHLNPTLAVTQKIPNDLSQWQPRIAVAWDFDKKITIRGSSGLYAAPTPATFFHRIFADNGTQTITADSYFDPSLLLASGANTAAPHALAFSPLGLSTPNALVIGIAPTFRNPRSLQSAISIEDRVSAKLALTAGYIYGSAWRLERRLDENLAPPIISTNGLPQFLSPRPIAAVGRLLVEQSTSHSSYSGGYLSLNAPLSRRTTLLANYTLSRTRDDDSGGGPYSPVTALNPFNLQTEQAYSSLDQRQTLNVNAIVNLPVGFKLNPLFVAHSGLPYTPIVGFDTQSDANDWNDRIIVNGAVQPRNIYRQPGFANLDLRVVKDFTLKGEGHHLDLFMDVFNLTGAHNLRFDNQGVSLFGNAGSPVYSAGMPLFAPGVTQLGGPREIQFTVRLVGF
jgi:hypothetical protein